MAHEVAFHPLAESDLFSLYDYIEHRSGAALAIGYIDRIETLCAKLGVMPERGKSREDLGARIRTIALERRVLIVYRPDTTGVVILRVLYAGRTLEHDDVPD